MMFNPEALQGLVPILVLIAIAAGAFFAWRRREGPDGEDDEGIGTLRRIYFYFATVAYMIVASVGAVLVARYILDELFGPEVLDRDVTQLALGLVLALIWTPVWLWHRSRVARLPHETPAERRSVLRKVSVYLTLAITIGVTISGATEALLWLFRASAFSGYAVAAVAVWTPLWLMTWQAEDEEGQPSEETSTVRRVYLYGASAAGLAMLSAGVALALYVVLQEAYEGLVDLPVVFQGEKTIGGRMMKEALATAVVGGLVWGSHWFSFARRDRTSDLRQFYLYTLAILGGAVAALSSAGVLVYGSLQWGMGTPEQDTASAHFRFLPGALAPLAVALLIWAYHWTVVQVERAAAGGLLAAQRIYRYIMTAIGIAALAAAMIVLVPLLVGLIVDSAHDVLAGPNWWRDQMVLVFTLGLIGLPVWGYHWFAAQRTAISGGAGERYSLPRRVFLFTVIGLGTLASLGSISHILFVLLNAMLEDELSLTLLRDLKWSMGTLVTAVVFTPYHWLVLQEDRAVPEPVREARVGRKTVTLLIGEESADLVAQLENALDTTVRVLRRIDATAAPQLSKDQVQQLAQQIARAPGDRILLVAAADGVEVYPYR
jgi:hypothetical protein